MLGKNENADEESFRDSIATISKEGKRAWIFAQKPKGKLYDLRTYTSWIYLAVFFILPFIKIHDEPLFMINVLERKFILFSMVFWPQDFFIFMLGMLTFLMFIIVFTVIYGRVFCGWACPQTIFMEMVFRKIEYLIEGNAAQQKILSKERWTRRKIIKRTLKYVAFFVLSFLIANTFLAYLISIDEVKDFWTQPVSSHIGKLISLFIFTSVFFFVYAFFREQVCLVVCPYGRLQGVILDKNSIVVAYDYVRGETRHKFKKNEVRTGGDCVDCHQCVKVCPTGIDIRHGTQLECVNCTACIDACDNMMTSVGLPTGLIRYASENNIANKEKLHFTLRIKMYTAILVALISVLVFLLASRTDFDATILRSPGQTYQEQADGSLSNVYNITLTNKTHKDIPVTLKLEDADGEIKMVGKDISIAKESLGEGVFFVNLKKGAVKGHKTEIHIGIYNNDKKNKNHQNHLY